MNYLKQLFKSFGEMLIKIVGSRKSVYQIISKIITLHLIFSLQNELYIVIIFGISSICDFVYFGFIHFESVKTNINANI